MLCSVLLCCGLDWILRAQSLPHIVEMRNSNSYSSGKMVRTAAAAHCLQLGEAWSVVVFKRTANDGGYSNRQIDKVWNSRPNRKNVVCAQCVIYLFQIVRSLAFEQMDRQHTQNSYSLYTLYLFHCFMSMYGRYNIVHIAASSTCVRFLVQMW